MRDKLRVSIPPEWERIPLTGRQVADFIGKHGFDRDSSDAAFMVACELLENATKYGRYKGGEEIDVEAVVDGSTFIIEVKNPVVDEADESLERLDEMIQWIRGFQDPFQAYVERLKEVSAQSLDNRESGLGLVRVAYEGRAILDFMIDAKRVLSVSAVHRS